MEETTAKRQMTTTTKTLTSPSSSDSHHTLSFELVKEILCRLPVKTLVQFQCVCKSWKSLISNNYEFAKKHLHISITSHDPSRHHLMVKYLDSPISSVLNAVSDAKIPQTKLRYPPLLNIGLSSFEAVGSCHGIVCFQIPHYILFWNPSIAKFKLSSVRTHAHYGFGYDHVNDKYKLVSVSTYNHVTTNHDNVNVFSQKTIVKVHTFGTNCWRTIQEFPCGPPVGFSRWAGTFVAGSINWVTYYYGYHVVSLNLANESYQEISQPDYGEANVVSFTLGVLRDCLCIFAHGELVVDVWIMKEYGEKDSWNKLFTIPFIGDADLYPCMATYISEDEQVFMVSEHKFQSPQKFMVYDSKSGTFKFPEIEIKTAPIVYVESLITTCS